jgi:DNA-binding response OmpR family regulator
MISGDLIDRMLMVAMPGKMILIVEDEPSIAEVVSLYLKRADYDVAHASDGEQAMAYLENEIPDLVILDVMLPSVDGFAITRWLRDRSSVPIILLTSRRDEVDRIAGLELGADDYVVKPFSPQELVSRVRAVLRRTSGDSIKPETQEERLELGELVIDPLTRTVSLRGEPISLTVKEFDLLFVLAKHPRQVFSRDQLLDRVWGVADYIDPSTVTVHVRRLREKIEMDSSKPIHLMTVWGVGYKYEP